MQIMELKGLVYAGSWIKIMKLIYGIQTCILFIGIRPIYSQRCAEFLPLISNIDQCNTELTQAKEQALLGKLNDDNKDETCSIYSRSTECIQELVHECELEDSVNLEHAQSILQDHMQGFGKLCEDELYYDRYNAYSNCYETNSNKTWKCLNDFNKAISVSHFEDTVEDPDSDYYDQGVCSDVDELYKCVKKVLNKPCGKDAVQFYAELSQYLVPDELAGHCESVVTVSQQQEQEKTDSGSNQLVIWTLASWCSLFWIISDTVEGFL